MFFFGHLKPIVASISLLLRNAVGCELEPWPPTTGYHWDDYLQRDAIPEFWAATSRLSYTGNQGQIVDIFGPFKCQLPVLARYV
jgi:D-alanyl-D-alanine dipeptidase